MVKKPPQSSRKNYQIQIRSLGPHGSKEMVGVGYMDKEKGWDHREYDAPYYSMSLIISGHGYYKLGNREFELVEGDLFQRFPGQLHCNRILSDHWEECFVDFGPTLWAALSAIGLSDPEQPCGKLPPDPHRHLRFKDLYRLFEKTPLEDSTRLLPQAMALAETCLREMKRYGKKEVSPMIREAKAILEADVSKRISLEALCLERGWKYETFRKSFRQQTGTSPHQYAIRHRMDEARLSLMAQPELSISELALNLGYNNVYEFSRHFKEVVGVSPKNFRG